MNTKFPPNNLRSLRKERGMTLQQVAEAFSEDITVGAIQKLETSVMELRHTHILKFAEIFGCSTTEIIDPATHQIRMVPVLGSISAGSWAEQVTNSNEFLPIPVKMGGPRMFALRPDGDSMNQLIGDADYVVVDPDQRDLMNGKSYAVERESGESVFKRFFEAPARLEPFSSNDTHKPIPLGSEPVRVIGRVIYAVKLP